MEVVTTAGDLIIVDYEFLNKIGGQRVKLNSVHYGISRRTQTSSLSRVPRGKVPWRAALPPSSVRKVERQAPAASGGRVTGRGSASLPGWLSCLAGIHCLNEDGDRRS